MKKAQDDLIKFASSKLYLFLAIGLPIAISLTSVVIALIIALNKSCST